MRWVGGLSRGRGLSCGRGCTALPEQSTQAQLPFCTLTANPQLVPHALNCQTARRIEIRCLDMFDGSSVALIFP